MVVALDPSALRALVAASLLGALENASQPGLSHVANVEHAVDLADELLEELARPFDRARADAELEAMLAAMSAPAASSEGAGQ
jgi:hypothetical protein